MKKWIKAVLLSIGGWFVFWVITGDVGSAFIFIALWNLIEFRIPKVIEKTLESYESQ